MVLPIDGFRKAVIPVDPSGNAVNVILTAGIYRLAVDAIIGSGGALTPILDNNAQAAGQTLLGTIPLNYFFDERATTWARNYGTSAPATLDGGKAPYIVQSRQSGYAAMQRGRRFSVANSDPTVFVTGQTAFLATTPTFMLRMAAAAGRVILRSITLSQAGVVAGGLISGLFVIDTTDRFSAGGLAVTPQNQNEESAQASIITSFLTNPTASAAGVGTRAIIPFSAPASLGFVTTIELEDGILLSPTSSALLYTFATTTGPSWLYNFEWEEVPA